MTCERKLEQEASVAVSAGFTFAGLGLMDFQLLLDDAARRGLDAVSSAARCPQGR